MAVDVSSFVADIPAGTYAIGDVITLKSKAGPAVVRSGNGAAYLKRISTYMLSDTSGSVTAWKVFIKNSDWVDNATSFAIPITSPTAMDRRSGAIQPGHDCPLTQNSSWEVYAVCVGGATTTVDNSVSCEIEIDYPQVSSITDPAALPGIPCSIEYDVSGLAVGALGSMESASWHVDNVDFFKAGYEYALEKVELVTDSGLVGGYVALANAAGMGGFTRIIPICSLRNNIRPPIEYASKLVKGPLDIKIMFFNLVGAATTANVKLVFDFVKRRI